MSLHNSKDILKSFRKTATKKSVIQLISSITDFLSIGRGELPRLNTAFLDI